MHQPKDLPKTPNTDREQRPTDPGPTTGGMGSVGSQPDEPSLEEKLGMDEQPGPLPDTSGNSAESEQENRR